MRWSTGRTKGLVSVAFLTTVLGCGTGLGVGPLSELERQERLWQATRPIDYRYGVRRICFCGFEAIGPVRVTVSADDVIARTYIDTGDPVSAQFEDLYPSVDGLFEVLRDAIERDAHRIDVTYDPVTAVPTDISIDYLENVADDELGFSVVEEVGPVPR